MPGRPRKPPRFATEAEEREFWARHDSADHLDWDRARFMTFPDLKPASRLISIRVPESLLDDLRVIANRRDVPYQSLIKIWLAERVKDEVQDTAAPTPGARARTRPPRTR